MKKKIDKLHLGNLQRFSQAFGVFEFFFGLLSLISWHYDWNFITAPSLHESPMSPNIALSLMIIGQFLYFDSARKNPRLRHASTAATAFFLFAIGIAALLGHAFPDREFWLNHALMDLLVSTAQQGIPLLSLPTASSAFCLLSFAVSLLLMRIWPISAQLFLVPTLIIPLAALLAVTFKTVLYGDLLGLQFTPGMPVHVSTAFFFSAISLLAAYPRSGFLWRILEKSPAGDAFRILSFSILTIPILLAAASLAVHWLSLVYSVHIYSTLLTLMISGFLISTALVIRKLEQSEGKFYQLMAESGDGIILANLNGQISDVNAAACELLGYESIEELLGIPLKSLIPQESWPYLDAVRFDLLHPGALHRGEWTLKHKKGHLVDVEFCSKFLPAEDIWQTTVRDITLRKKAEDLLRFLSEFSQLLSESPEFDGRLQKVVDLTVPRIADFCAIYTKENDQIRIRTSANLDPNKADLLLQLANEYPPQHTKLIGRSYSEVAPLKIYENLSRTHLLAFASDEKHSRLLLDLGTKSYLSAPLVAHGFVIGSISMGILNETRCFHREDADFLNQMVHRIAMALDNARLYRDALIASRAREDILAIVSHDLKNPIAAIDLTTQVAIMKADSGLTTKELTSYLRSIRQLNQRMKRMVEMLLNVGKLHAGTFVATRKPMNISTLLNDQKGIFAPIASRSLVTLEVLAKEPGEFEGDFDALSQVMSILISNAIKRSPAHTTVTVAGNLTAENIVEFSVEDQGTPIPREQREKIFDQFWRLEIDKKDGSGLSLYVVVGVIRAHGGKVAIQNTSSGGNKFLIQFPRTAKFDEAALPRAEVPADFPPALAGPPPPSCGTTA